MDTDTAIIRNEISTKCRVSVFKDPFFPLLLRRFTEKKTANQSVMSVCVAGLNLKCFVPHPWMNMETTVR